MALEHNAIGYGVQLSRAAARAVGMSDAEGGLSRMGETLTPTFDLWSLPEWQLLRGEIPFARWASQALVAARFSSVELVNPAGSGVIATVRGIWVEGGSVDISIDTGPALGVNGTFRGVCRDSRFPQLGESSRCTVVTGDFAAGAVNSQIRLRTLVVAPPFWDFVLAPGFKLFAINAASGVAQFTSYSWTERAPFPGELQARG